MWKTCGKRVEKCPKNVENCPKNVGNFVEKMWECGKHVENMWETHLYVQMCKIVANYTNVSQFFFFFVFFFMHGYVHWYICECAVVLFNCMLSHVARNVREERVGVAVYLSNENGGAYIFKIRYICIYKCLIFLRVREFRRAYQWLYKIQGICFIVLGFCLCFTISLKKFYIRVGAVGSAGNFFRFSKAKTVGEKSTFKTYPTPLNNNIHNFGKAIEIQ